MNRRALLLRALYWIPASLLYGSIDPLSETAAAVAALASVNKGPGTVSRRPWNLSEEELRYDIHFWLFKKVAEVRLSFSSLDGDKCFKATLVGKPKGIMNLFVNYRTYTFRSYMEAVSSRRLRSLRFEREAKKGEDQFLLIYDIDPKRKRLIFRLLKNGQENKRRVTEIPQGLIVEDLLSAMYNLRLGAFGPLHKGLSCTVPLCTRKGITRIKADFLSGTNERKHRRLMNASEDGFIVHVKVPPEEIFPSKEGIIFLWASINGLVLKGILKDALLLGDLSGEIRGPG